jgi:predicted TPR repeat methyltransferase
MTEDAITVYDKILKLDNKLQSIWFNKAQAHVKIDDVEGAIFSLQKTLEFDNPISAAQHMLKALTESEALKAVKVDEVYIKDLFDSYAEIYDAHGKKLLYSAPRIIRQELAKIYKSRFAENDKLIDSFEVQVIEKNIQKEKEKAIISSFDKDFVEANTPVGSSCSSYTSFMNNSLDILDIGCGTGLAGAWLKDYAKSLVGVDISEQMVNIARKKMLYQDIQVKPISQYLNECTSDFDIVVAADVLSYIGELSEIFDQVKYSNNYLLFGKLIY